MKKALVLLVSLTLCIGLFAGCSGEQAGGPPAAGTKTPSDSTAAATPSAQLTGTVATDGSTSMEKVIGSLSEAFMGGNGGVNVTYNATGSSAGITAVTEKRCDIGLSSRALKDEEKKNLTETILALDGIAVVVNKQSQLADLSVQQIADLYTGKITNWKDVGGADGPVVLIGREAGSGTRDGFETITGTKENCKYNQELTSTGAVIEAVKSNPNAIGYASLSAVSETVKALTVNGVAPTEATVLDGSYQVQRPFVMATRSGEALSAPAQAFLDYATSVAASEIITGAGAVPVAK